MIENSRTSKSYERKPLVGTDADGFIEAVLPVDGQAVLSRTTLSRGDRKRFTLDHRSDETRRFRHVAAYRLRGA
jgi:hypothetical protein